MASARLTSDLVKAQAGALGFELCGIAPAGSLPELGRLREWLGSGYAGEMAYMHRTAAARADVRNVLPSARSVIVAGAVYNTGRPYSIELDDPRRATIARYAWGEDYHVVLRERLEALLHWMRAEEGGDFDARLYVDTGPVQERVYALHAGLGWIGKNTCLINPALGSWLLLGEIIVSLDLEPDRPEFDHCGSCTLCLESCPTNALAEPGVLDATKCISYLTIELRGPIPAEARDAVSNHVFGCDICQEVCPWNQVAARSRRPEWQPRAIFDAPPLVELWKRPDRELSSAVKTSALSRARVRGLRRTTAVALGNSGDPAALEVLREAGAGSPSRADPVIAEHVEWARRKLLAVSGHHG